MEACLNGTCHSANCIFYSILDGDDEAVLFKFSAKLTSPISLILQNEADGSSESGPHARNRNTVHVQQIHNIPWDVHTPEIETSTNVVYAVYPIKYAYSFCYALVRLYIQYIHVMLWLTFVSVTSQSSDCPSANDVTLKHMSKTNPQHNKTPKAQRVCVIIGMFCTVQRYSMLLYRIRLANAITLAGIDDIGIAHMFDWFQLR